MKFHMNLQILMKNDLDSNVIIVSFPVINLSSWKELFSLSRRLKLRVESILIPTGSIHFGMKTKSSVRQKC